MTGTHAPLSLSPRGGESSPAEVFAEGWRLFLRHRLLIIVLPFLVAVAVVGWAITRPRTYTSSASFVASGPDASKSGLSSLASQFGVRIPTGDVAQSPRFYADLLRSRQLLSGVVQSTYSYRDEQGRARTGTLMDVFASTGNTPGLRLENAMATLDHLTGVSVGAETGLVRVGVTTEDAGLSAAIVRRFVDLLNQFNLETRQTRATAERKFTQARVQEVEQELRQAENRLDAFLRANRSYVGSPSLVTQKERLERDVNMRQQVYTSLMQAYEQARIDEVRDTPAITLVEPPYVPARPDGRGLLRRAILGAVVGLLVGLALAAGRELRGRQPGA